MVNDPSQTVPILQAKPQTFVQNGRVTIPYYNNNGNYGTYPKVKKDDQKEHLFFPLVQIETPEEIIIEGGTIPLLHGVPNFNPSNFSQVVILARCTIAQHGYATGEEPSIHFGANYEVSSTEILVNIMAGGLKVVKKSGNKQQGRLSVSRWKLFARGIFYVDLLEPNSTTLT